MADDSAATPVVHGDDVAPAAVADPAPATAVAAAAADAATVADEIKLLGYAVRELPAQAVNDLMRHRVCARCICRLFNIHEGIYALVSSSTLCSIIGKANVLPSSQESQVKSNIQESEVKYNIQESEVKSNVQESEVKANVCPVCLGVLQFRYRDGKDTWVEKDHAEDFAVMVAECVKKKGHEIDSFTLEVSVPPNITGHDQAFMSYVKEKYGSDVYCREKISSGHISVKDAFKQSITHPLERLLGVKSGICDFRIRLTYDSCEPPCASSSYAEDRMGKNQCNKRIKTGAEVSNFCNTEGNGLTKCSNRTLQDGAFSDFKFPPQVSLPCQMTLVCSRAPIYIGGRYLKFSRNVSQTCWIINDERKGEASVEEIIGGNILPLCNGDGYKFHAAGRQDIDVRMLGSGRPFLVEIQNARHVPSEASIKEMEKTINTLERKLVRVKHLKVLGSQGWTLMREGEVEKQKQYAALVGISRPIEDEDLQAVSSLKDLQVVQRTPIRVLHRRSPLEHEKIIHWMKIEEIAGSSQYFLLHLCTQATTRS